MIALSRDRASRSSPLRFLLAHCRFASACPTQEPTRARSAVDGTAEPFRFPDKTGPRRAKSADPAPKPRAERLLSGFLKGNGAMWRAAFARQAPDLWFSASLRHAPAAAFQVRRK